MKFKETAAKLGMGEAMTGGNCRAYRVDIGDMEVLWSADGYLPEDGDITGVGVYHGPTAGIILEIDNVKPERAEITLREAIMCARANDSRTKIAVARFNEMLRAEIGDDAYDRLCHADPAMHTPHDECDANMLAFDAFAQAFGREPVLTDEADLDALGLIQEIAETARDLRDPTEYAGRG